MGYVYEELPCSFLELPKLERVLEKKAEEGLMICKLTVAGTKGKYAETSKGTSHISIGAYDKVLSESVQRSPEFERFAYAWQAYGWQKICCFLNLVVFYSDEEERPPVPSAARGFYEKGIYRVTARIERLLFLMRVLWVLFTALIVSGGLGLAEPIVENAYRQGNYEAPLTILLLLFFLTFLSGISAMVLRHIRACRYLRREKPVPEFELFWNEQTILLLNAVLMSVNCILFGVLEYSPKALKFGGIGLVLTGMIVIWLFKNRISGKKDDGGLSTVLSVVAFITVIIMMIGFPLPGEYRYQTSGGTRGDFRAYETEKILAEGLDPVQMDWYERTYSFYEERTHLLCSGERVIYHVDDSSIRTRGRRKYEAYRYVGTIRAELKDEAYLDRYLRQKRLSLNGAEKLPVGEQMTYYLTDSGKEIIGIAGKEVVIYFLNKADERLFQSQDETLMKAIARQEQKLLQPAPKR